MPSIEENRRYWNGGYSWLCHGDEWSKDWGDVSMQWYGTILPRIHSFLDAGTILEVGCGFGRWTKYLKDHCHRLMAIDLSEQCIAACRQRFEAAAHVSFYCNDGKSLAVVDDESVDFVFSFDALPLVDQSTIEAYLTQLPRVLKPNGVAFLHHSNLGRYRRRSRLFAGMPKLELVLRRLGWMERDLHWRDPSVSAELVENLASLHGLRCASQEIFRWGTKRLFIETFTVLVRELSDWRRECVRLENDWFDREVANLSRLARLYVRDCRG